MKPNCRSFSLIEVVVALCVCSFALISILGLFTLGLQSDRESQDTMQAADLASLLATVSRAAPTNLNSQFVIPPNSLMAAYATVYQGYVGFNGLQTVASQAAYAITCQAGTNATTGPNVAQLYILLSWPPRASTNSVASRHYELLTYIPLNAPSPF